MNTKINLTGKNSGDIYYLTYPKNLLYFMKYDFNLFMERCVDLCKLYMKTGEFRQEETAEIRNSISGCHKYFEQNLRGIFEKIVIDCWVEYICRQNEIGVITLWNNYIPCKNDFEKAIFMRLSEYRHGYSINQWVNILKVQEYANIKTDFIFGGRLKNTAEAAARANYFDLMFNVVANELGYDLNTSAENKVYTMGRTPNSPFIMSSVSREIVRNLLADLKYGNDNKTNVKKSEAVHDQTAMDAFASMKAYLPMRDDNIVETIIKSLAQVPMRVYMPTSLKAAVDLEIDVIIENNSYLQRCELCKDYYLRSEDYDYDYCDKPSKSGKTCVDIMSKKGVKTKTTRIAHDSIDAALLNERCDRLYKEMSSRINVEFTQRDFSDWCRYMNTIRDNVLNGQASLRDFENFAEYSRSMSFLPDAEDKEENTKRISSNKRERRETEISKDEKGRTVKPFVFERVNRKDLKKPEPVEDYYDDDYEEEEAPVNIVSPRVSSKIIRGVAPEAYSPGVTIPYGQDSRERIQPLKEEGVKIYQGKKAKEPEKPAEYVKVFNPKKSTVKENPVKPVIKHTEPLPEDNFKAEIKRQKGGQSTIINRELSGQSTTINREISEKPRIPAFSSPLQENKIISLRERENSPPPAISLNVPPRKITSEKPSDYSKSPVSDKAVTQPLPPAISRIYASQKMEETTEIGFADILRGLERKDGFNDENIPTDSEGVPVSHKTKRVMDAIFKQSKPSLFVNINKDE